MFKRIHVDAAVDGRVAALPSLHLRVSMPKPWGWSWRSRSKEPSRWERHTYSSRTSCQCCCVSTTLGYPSWMPWTGWRQKSARRRPKLHWEVWMVRRWWEGYGRAWCRWRNGTWQPEKATNPKASGCLWNTQYLDDGYPWKLRWTRRSRRGKDWASSFVEVHDGACPKEHW